MRWRQKRKSCSPASQMCGMCSTAGLNRNDPHRAGGHPRPAHGSRAALGIGRNTITRKIQELGLDAADEG